MTKFLYCNIALLEDNKIAEYLKILPQLMRDDILRYKKLSDQKSRLLARLMLYRCLEIEGKANLINNLERDSNKKPFIQGWNAFNISHSEDIVVFVFSENTIGVDIEKRLELNYKEMSEYLHPLEKKYIMESVDIENAFYEIWVKKEAVLKAIGVGILVGLNELNCINDSVCYNGNMWYFHSLKIHPNYTSYLCNGDENSDITAIEYIL